MSKQEFLKGNPIHDVARKSIANELGNGILVFQIVRATEDEQLNALAEHCFVDILELKDSSEYQYIKELISRILFSYKSI